MTLPDDAVLAAAAVRSRAARLAYPAGAGWMQAERAFAGVATAEAFARAALTLLGDGTWLSRMIDPLLAELRADPWFEPPLRARRDAGRIAAVLFESDIAVITAQVLRPGQPEAETVILSGRMAVHGVVAGQARLLLCQEDGSREERSVGVGMCLAIDGRRTGHVVVPIDGDVMTLTATTSLDAAALARELRLDTEAVVRTAMTDDRTSRAQLLLGFLRAAGRREAVACFEAATHDAAWFLRWDAMREWLALDAESAAPRLDEMAERDPHPEVRAAAAATIALLAQRRAA